MLVILFLTLEDMDTERIQFSKWGINPPPGPDLKGVGHSRWATGSDKGNRYYITYSGSIELPP
jgi:hypothetical protein